MKTKSELKWACRRGMLELDLLLEHYLDHDYDQLNPADQALFTLLLSEADQDLFSWLFADARPKPPFEPICEKIKLFREQH